jgi:hypothetical protein
MLFHERGKYFSVVLGVAMALFLVLLQSGFYFGFLRDITVVADSFDADLWISQRKLLAFDYVAHFDDLPQWQALADADVAGAMPVVVEWTRVRSRLDGASEDGLIIGLDLTARVPVNLGTDASLDLKSLLECREIYSWMRNTSAGLAQSGSARPELRFVVSTQTSSV